MRNRLPRAPVGPLFCLHFVDPLRILCHACLISRGLSVPSRGLDPFILGFYFPLCLALTGLSAYSALLSSDE
jgi:hypothetical protein